MDFVSLAAGLSGPFGYAILFFLALVLSAVIFLPVPVFAIVVLAASVLDPFWVGVVAGVASAIGELSSYFVGALGEKALKKKEGAIYAQSRSIFKKYGFWGIVAVTIFPLTLIDLMGIIAGGLRYGWKKFLLAAVIGKIPRYLIVAYAGKKVIEGSMGFATERPIASLIAILITIAAFDFWYFLQKRKINAAKQKSS